MPDNITFTRLVDLAKLRWRIERDYQDLKQELGLGHLRGADGGIFTTTLLCASMKVTTIT